MIEFDRVCFSYGTRELFRDLSFHIRAGERTALSGSS